MRIVSIGSRWRKLPDSILSWMPSELIIRKIAGGEVWCEIPGEDDGTLTIAELVENCEEVRE